MVQKVSLSMTEDIASEINDVSVAVDDVASALTALDGSLGTASTRDVGTGATDVVETSELDTRIGTSGNLGTAAQKNFGTADGNLPEYKEEIVDLGGDYIAGTFGQVKCVRVGSLVTITGIENFLDHTDGLTQPASSAGAIPTWARPESGQTNNLYQDDASANYRVEVTSTGVLTTFKRNRSDGLYVARDATSRPSITFATTVAF